MINAGMQQLPKILLNWNYERTDLLSAFLKLTDAFEFVFIYRYNSETDNAKNYSFKIIYWNDFKSPYEIIDEIKPAKIIFHDIESFHQVALNLAAKNRDIPTYVLEHGLRGEYEIDIEIKLEKIILSESGKENKNVQVNSDDRNSFKTLLFYLRSFQTINILTGYDFLKFIFARKKYGLTNGLCKMRKEFRWAERYINFTRRNSSYIFKRDGVPENRFTYIGNPYFDDLFKQQLQFLSETNLEKYIVLIDAPFVETFFRMKAEIKRDFIYRLNSFAKKQELKLKIKLHPVSYNSKYPAEDQNIEYIKNDDVLKLILNAEGCAYVHLSTLTPFGMYFKPFIFFNVYPEFNKPFEDMGIPMVELNEIENEMRFYNLNEHQKEIFILEFLYSTDGMATERLKRALLN